MLFNTQSMTVQTVLLLL